MMIMIKNIQELQDKNSQMLQTQCLTIKIKKLTHRHVMLKLKTPRQRQDMKSNQIEEASHQQRNDNQTCSRDFL